MKKSKVYHNLSCDCEDNCARDVIHAMLENCIVVINNGQRIMPTITLLDEIEGKTLHQSSEFCHCENCDKVFSKSFKALAKSSSANASIITDLHYGNSDIPPTIFFTLEREGTIEIHSFFLQNENGVISVYDHESVCYSINEFPSHSKIYRILPQNQKDLMILC